MADTTALRRIVLLGALIVTIAACLLPVDEPPPHVPRAARSTRAVLAAAPVEAERPAPAEAVDVDPFAPRAWQAEPAAPVLAAAPPPVAPMVGPMPPAPPAPPPPLPFQFMGRLTDGLVPVVYLSHGEQTLVARSGETLEQTYKVLGIGATQIEFMYLPTGERQLMPLPVPGN